MASTPRFISLKVKLAMLWSLFVSLCCGLFALLAWHHLQQQQLLALERQSLSMQREWQAMVEQQTARVIDISKLVIPSLLDDGSLNVDLAERYLRQWQQHLDVSGVALFDLNNQRLLEAGQALLPPLPRRNSWAGTASRCGSHCQLQVLIPTTIGEQRYQLLLLLPLEPLLNQFGRANRIKLAVLAQSNNGLARHNDGPPPLFIPAWQRSLIRIEGTYFEPTLITAAKSLPAIDSLAQQPAMISVDDGNWSLELWPFNNSGEQLLVAQSLDQFTQLQRQLGQQLLLAWLLMMVATMVLVRAGLRTPMARLRRLMEGLPLMAQSRFEAVRQRFPNHSNTLVDEVDQLEQVAVEVNDQLQQQEGEFERYTGELKRMAMFDDLTGLPNRAMFLHELTAALSSIGRTDKQIGLLFIDLDDFKRTNDTLGHEIGDELLKTVAKRLQKSVRGMDIVCRLGGDEFVVIVRGLASEANVHRIIHQLFTSLQQPLQLGRHTLIVTASIGVAFSDNPTMRPEELIKHADLAMYKAKHAGRCNYRVFNEQMLQTATRREALQQQIGIAIDNQQIVMALQPIIDLNNGDVVGFEALCRWYRPDHGLVLPEQFINELEGCKQSLALAEDVVKQTIALLARLSKQMNRDDFFVSMNLGPCQFLHQPLLAQIKAQLGHYQLAPQRLMIEVTEEALIRDLEQATAMMQSYKALGVKIAIDDFGTGYSSLSYLKKLPFDVLKVDKDLVAELDNSNVDRSIVTSVIDLAHSLGRVVVAEGVENHDQRHFLKRSGCDYAQGYLYATPMDQHQLQSALNKLPNLS